MDSERTEAPRSARLAAAERLLRVALWLALVAGFLEVAVVLARRGLLREFTWTSRDVVWMAPLSYALFFAAGALLMLPLVLRRPDTPLRTIVAPFAIAMAFALMSITISPRLNRLAVVVLALGMGLQAARWVEGHGAGFARLVRRTTPVLLALVLLLAVALPGARRWRERRALAALPAAPAGAPNVLLIILDTVRAASLSLYGAPQPTTPKLARWAARGVVFEQALATAPWTLPSHGSLFTGRYPHELSTGWQTPLDGRYPTLAERFSRHGYRTAGFVANHFFTSHETGLDRGFLRYEDFRRSFQQVVLSSAIGQTVQSMHDAAAAAGSRRDIVAATWRALRPPPERLAHRKPAPVVREEFERWLEERPRDRPFFAFLNFFDAHKPYAAPKEYRRRITGSALPRRDYEASIAFMDDEVSRILGDLARRDELRNTLVVITSDHGEQFGEHGLTGHGNSLYLPLLRVPLIVMLPDRVPAGVRLDTAVTLRDLPATIVDLAGLRDSVPMPGRSLARLWDGTAPDSAASALLAAVGKGVNTPPAQPVSRGDMHALITMPWHYIRNGDGREELYDIASDPAEDRDLSGSRDARTALLRSREAVDVLLNGPARAVAERQP